MPDLRPDPLMLGGRLMARLPRWLEIAPPYKGTLASDSKSVEFTIRIRKWHPAFWWIVFQMLVLRRDPLTRKVDR